MRPEREKGSRGSRQESCDIVDHGSPEASPRQRPDPRKKGVRGKALQPVPFDLRARKENRPQAQILPVLRKLSGYLLAPLESCAGNGRPDEARSAGPPHLQHDRTERTRLLSLHVAVSGRTRRSQGTARPFSSRNPVSSATPWAKKGEETEPRWILLPFTNPPSSSCSECGITGRR